MLTFEIVLKVLITAFLGYFTINSIFRYHFSMDRITIIFLIAVLVLMVFYRGATNGYMFLITVGIFVVFYIILYLYSLIKKDLGYFLFNTYGKDHQGVLGDLHTLTKKHNIPLNNICYNKKRPFLIVFRNEKFKKVRKLMKEMDEIYTKKKKRFTMYNYWVLVAFLVLAAGIWRF